MLTNNMNYVNYKCVVGRDSYVSMLLILDINSEHVAHAAPEVKLVFWEKKISICDCFQINQTP